jgi:hypothetical protein
MNAPASLENFVRTPKKSFATQSTGSGHRRAALATERGAPISLEVASGRDRMFAVTGITGQVGGAAARTLLDTGQSVRGVMRDTAKGAAWSAAARSPLPI